MSYRTWSAEFYPTSAAQQARSSDDELAALQHSLRKWEGLRGSNLKRHGLEFDPYGGVVDQHTNEDVFSVHGDTCALCGLYHKGGSCVDCPLYQVRGIPCDAAPGTEFGGPSPFHSLNQYGPGRMIRLIKTAIRRCIKKRLAAA